jgi:tetratricopeptide (TPR) repeat protein
MNLLLNKGNALNNLSRYSEAIFSFDRVLDTYPDQDIALNGKGKALLMLGNYTGAITYFDKILSMNSSDIDITNEASKNKIEAVNALNNLG